MLPWIFLVPSSNQRNIWYLEHLDLFMFLLHTNSFRISTSPLVASRLTPCNCTWTPSTTPIGHHSGLGLLLEDGSNSRSPTRRYHTQVNSIPYPISLVMICVCFCWAGRCRVLEESTDLYSSYPYFFCTTSMIANSYNIRIKLHACCFWKVYESTTINKHKLSSNQWVTCTDCTHSILTWAKSSQPTFPPTKGRNEFLLLSAREDARVFLDDAHYLAVPMTVTVNFLLSHEAIVQPVWTPFSKIRIPPKWMSHLPMSDIF